MSMPALHVHIYVYIYIHIYIYIHTSTKQNKFTFKILVSMGPPPWEDITAPDGGHYVNACSTCPNKRARMKSASNDIPKGSLRADAPHEIQVKGLVGGRSPPPGNSVGVVAYSISS